MLLFFDVDGTLVNRNNEVREKTVEAIRQARKNGHICFINSGRCRAFIQDEPLLNIGFDGIVSACGTMIEYGGRTVFNHLIPAKDVAWSIETARSHGFCPLLEGPDHIYLEPEDYSRRFFGNNIVEVCMDRIKGINECRGSWEINKFSCEIPDSEEEAEKCYKELSEYYNICIHWGVMAEMVPLGFNKGLGIKKVCELLGEDIKNTIAFGDSYNDEEMLTTADIGIGIASKDYDLSSFCDYITAPLEEDGIWKAMKHFELI